MTVDLRKLLKACIRGQMYDYDCPVLPACNPDGEEFLSDEEKSEFVACTREVFEEDEAEEPETRQSVIRQREYLLAFRDPGDAPAFE